MIPLLALRHGLGPGPRTFFPALGLALGVLLISILWTVPSGVRAFLDRLVSEQRLSVTSRGGVSYGLPPAMARRLRALPGVSGAMAITYFGGALADGTPLSFPTLAVEAPRVGRVYPDYEIPAGQLAAFARYRDGALVGERTLADRRWRIGDRIELASSIWGVRVGVEIVGVLPGQPGLWLRLSQLEEALRKAGRRDPPWLSLVWLRIAAAADLGEVSEAVLRLGREAGVPLATQSEGSFFGRLLEQLRALGRLFEVVSWLVAACLAIVLGSALSLGMRARARELATLRALGSPRRLLVLMGVVESLTLALAGALPGLAAAAALPRLVARVPALRAFAGIAPGAEALGAGLAAALGVGFVAGAASGLEAALRPLAPALREGARP